MIFLMKRIYLDYASLTPIDRGVMKEMKKYSTGEYTNPSSLYLSGVKAKKAIEEARSQVAQVLHAHPDEIYFTHGGTHGNDLVLNDKKQGDKRKIIISAIEHSSITKLVEAIRIPVDSSGLINVDFFKKNLTTDTFIVSIMLVNNEIGVIEPIHQIVKIVRDFNKVNNTKILVHTDACQAGYLTLHVEKLGIDALTLDGNKIYGPRSTGIIYIRRGSMKVEEKGTLGTQSIVGFAYGLKKSEKFVEKESARLLELKTFFLNELYRIDPKIRINGSLENSSPHILNVSIPNIDNEYFILQLDANGVECSTKSACLRDENESYVLKAIGADSQNSVRFSFGRETDKSDLKKVIKIIEKILQTSRK